ncbi:MAG TPA: hypothetical protein VIY72_02100 [Acidimicrobiales bacterium]
MTATRNGRPKRRVPVAALVVALLLVAVVGLGVKWALDNTLTRHQPVDPDSGLLVTVRVERQSQAEHDEGELVEALFQLCHLEVGSTVVDDSVVLVDDDRDLYTAQFRPSLDRADQRQLRGCLEDLRIDHFRAWVQTMEHQAT